MMSKRNITRYIPLRQTLFLDRLFDRRTRRIFIYAFLMIVIGASLYRWLEGWSWIDSFYFVVVTLTTIGYGDFAPTTPLTKLITIFYGLNGVILLLMMFEVVRTKRHWTLEDPTEEEVLLDKNPTS
jgi:voltage-gated potassium channel